MERIVEIDSRMEAVYEKIFEDNKYIFSQNEYEKTLKETAEGKLPKDSHIFLGMTPRIYEELGFQRLPMAITNAHLYTTLRSSGALPEFNYHDLGEDILSQLPRQLKNPLLIVQSPNDEAEIIGVIGLTDKKGGTIIVPVAQYQKGNINGAEIDINLVKSTYGKKGFENWLKEAVDDKRLLYIDKKKTEPIWTGQGFRQVYQHFPDRSILPPELKPSDVLQNISGFLPKNIAHYQEAVKKKFPERFTPSGERILYKDDDDQLLLDFAQPPKSGLLLNSETNNKKFSASDFIRVEDKFFPHYLKENPEFRSGMIGFYIPSYESKIDNAIKEYAQSVMDKKPKAIISCGTIDYHGKIDGRDAVIGRDPSYRNSDRYIRIEFKDERQLGKEIETAKKAGYVQGVCESVAAVGGEKNMAVKLLSEMNVNRDAAKKFANPQTYKTLEKSVFAQKQEQKLEQTRSRKL
jgi:hypothetical protein